MITLRMLAIASALLLGTPLLVAAFPDDPDAWWDEVTEVQGEASAWVEDVRLAALPAPVTGRSAEVVPEQLVEGHTVFAVLNVHVWRNETEGVINVTGYVDCKHSVGIATRNGVPSRVDHAGAECRVYERVVVRPNSTTAPWTWFTPLEATGRIQPFTTPSGQPGYAEELSYVASYEDGRGQLVQQTLYAWAVPIYPAWLHVDGRPASFLAPLPEDRLREMGVDRFDVLFEDDPRLG